METIKEKVTYGMAKKRVRVEKSLYINLALFALVFTLWFALKMHKYGTIQNVSIVFIIWGIFLIIKALKVFLFNADWEINRLNKELEKQ